MKKPINKNHNSPSDMLARLGILIGCGLGVLAIGIAFAGYLPALLLLIPAVLCAGWRRITDLIIGARPL